MRSTTLPLATRFGRTRGAALGLSPCSALLVGSLLPTAGPGLGAGPGTPGPGRARARLADLGARQPRPRAGQPPRLAVRARAPVRPPRLHRPDRPAAALARRVVVGRQGRPRGHLRHPQGRHVHRRHPAGRRGGALLPGPLPQALETQRRPRPRPEDRGRRGREQRAAHVRAAVRGALHRARLLVPRHRLEGGGREGRRRVRAAAGRHRPLHPEGLEGREHAALRAERGLPEPPRGRREQGRAVPGRVADLHRQGGGDADGGPRDGPAPHVVGAVRGGPPDPEGPAAPAVPPPEGRLLHLPGVQHQEAALRQARAAAGHRLLGGLEGGARRLVSLRHGHPGAPPARRPGLFRRGRPPVRLPARRGEGGGALQGGRLHEGRRRQAPRRRRASRSGSRSRRGWRPRSRARPRSSRPSSRPPAWSAS